MMYAFIHRPRVPEGTQQPVSISRNEGLMLSKLAKKTNRLPFAVLNAVLRQQISRPKGADDFKTIDDSRILKTQTTCRTHQPNCQRTKRTRPPISRERVRKRKV